MKILQEETEITEMTPKGTRFPLYYNETSSRIDDKDFMQPKP
jgi:hypothetical protein